MNTQGFKNEGEFLDANANWLRARSARISAERDLADAVAAFEAGEDEKRRWREPAHQIRCRAVTLREQEEAAYDELLKRMDVHRMGDYPALAVDTIAYESDLSEDERVILVAVTLACLGNPLAEGIFGRLFTPYSGIQVSDLVQLMGAQQPSEWLSYRGLFLPDAPLLKNGHLTYDRVPQGPEGVMDVTVALGKETFAILTGGGPEPESYASPFDDMDDDDV